MVDFTLRLHIVDFPLWTFHCGLHIVEVVQTRDRRRSGFGNKLFRIMLRTVEPKRSPTNVRSGTLARRSSADLAHRPEVIIFWIICIIDFTFCIMFLNKTNVFNAWILAYRDFRSREYLPVSSLQCTNLSWHFLIKITFAIHASTSIGDMLLGWPVLRASIFEYWQNIVQWRK